MSSLTRFLFAALGAVSIIGAGAKPGSRETGEESGRRSTELQTEFETFQLDVPELPTLAEGVLNLGGKFDFSKTMEVLKKTGKGEDIEYPDLFREILIAAKKKEVQTLEASNFFHGMVLLGAPDVFCPHIEYFGNILDVYSAFENSAPNKRAAKKTLRHDVKRALDDQTNPTYLGHSVISKTIAPLLTELITFKDDNPKSVAAKLVSVFLENPIVKNGIRKSHCKAVPPSGKVWPHIKSLLSYFQKR